MTDRGRPAPPSPSAAGEEEDSEEMAGVDGERWVGLAATDLSEGSRAALRWTALFSMLG